MSLAQLRTQLATSIKVGWLAERAERKLQIYCVILGQEKLKISMFQQKQFAKSLKFDFSVFCIFVKRHGSNKLLILESCPNSKWS